MIIILITIAFLWFWIGWGYLLGLEFIRNPIDKIGDMLLWKNIKKKEIIKTN